MSTLTTLRTRPQLPIAVLMGVAGAAKVAGAQFTRDNFARWGYPDAWRPAIGVVEVATAVTALVGLRSDSARRLAGAGTLSTMGGAIATHVSSGDAAPNLIPPVLLAGLGSAALFPRGGER